MRMVAAASVCSPRFVLASGFSPSSPLWRPLLREMLSHAEGGVGRRRRRRRRRRRLKLQRRRPPGERLRHQAGAAGVSPRFHPRLAGLPPLPRPSVPLRPHQLLAPGQVPRPERARRPGYPRRMRTKRTPGRWRESDGDAVTLNAKGRKDRAVEVDRTAVDQLLAGGGDLRARPESAVKRRGRGRGGRGSRGAMMRVGCGRGGGRRRRLRACTPPHRRRGDRPG